MTIFVLSWCYVLPLASCLADVQDITDDAFGDVGRRLIPCDLERDGGQRTGSEAFGGGGEVFALDHSQAGAGLVGPGAVLSDALIDGLVVWTDAGQSESAAGMMKQLMSLSLKHIKYFFFFFKLH